MSSFGELPAWCAVAVKKFHAFQWLLATKLSRVVTILLQVRNLGSRIHDFQLQIGDFGFQPQKIRPRNG